MAVQAAGTLSTTLKVTFAATGSLAATLTAGMPATAAPVDHTAKVDPGRWADAFNGWSLGFGADYDFFRAPTSIDTYAFPTYDTFPSTLSGSSPFGDVDVGRDFRTGNYVFGIYGNFFGGEKLATFQSNSEYSATDTLKLQYGGSVTGRAGFLANPQTLFYGLFGWTWQHYEASLGPRYAPPEYVVSESGTLNGPTIGAGIEWLLPNHPNVSFKTEYRYTHFDSPGSITGTGLPSPPYPSGIPFADATFGNIDDHMIRFIMTFKLP